MRERYGLAFESIRGIETYTGHSLIGESAAAIVEKYGKFRGIVKANLESIDRKLKNPSTIQRIEDSRPLVAGFNAELEAINSAVRAHNEKLQDREATLEELKSEFWELMRWDYQDTISRYQRDRAVKESKLASVKTELRALNRDLEEERERIAKAQKQTVNTREAVDAINAGLAELGIEDFRIEEHSDRLYRVVRSGQSGDVFTTLSEGEKMIISFLYFCEHCRGRASPEEADVERIAVIDDPISSLSHVFIFNVGQLIKQRFFRDDVRFSQVFVLTHSLYFFYELAERSERRRKEKQGLFRLSKPASGSKLAEMKYNEVRNDYEAFWSVVNDPDAQPALIANCMRNIVEYFFGFVRGQTINNAFQSPELAEPRFQAFNRFVNRESHSDAQNIMDMKEFDYDTFKQGLRLVFEKAGYPDHFEKMCRM